MKTKSFQPAAMISACVLAFGCLVATRAPAAVVFYGGDSPDAGGKRLASFSHSTAGLTMVYDDFALSQDTTITRLWGNFSVGGESLQAPGFDDAPPEDLYARYEIRSGENGGMLVQSGTMLIVSTPTGRFFGNEGESQLAGGVNFLLGAGNYWLGIAPISDVARLLSTTLGSDVGPGGDPNPAPTGSPRANGNSFFTDSTYTWLPTNDPQLLGEGTWDFSYGIAGAPVPEPSTFITGALLALPFGLPGVRYLRNRRRA